MLYLIGLGLCDPSDITVKGLEVVKKASRVYLEAYTSILIASSKKDLVRGRGGRWVWSLEAVCNHNYLATNNVIIIIIL